MIKIKTKVFILGAGASKPAGIPLLKEILSEGFHLEMGSTGADSRSKYSHFIKFLEKKYNILLQRGEDWISLAEKTDIEKILSSIDEGILNGDGSLRIIRKEAVRFVFKRLEDAVSFGSNNNCYDMFVKKEIDGSNFENIIITFITPVQ